MPAAYIVKNITGTRFSELLRVSNEYGTVAAAQKWEAGRHREVKQRLRDLHMPAGHPLFSRMLDSPARHLNSDELDDLGLKTADINQLVELNILAAHAGQEYSCAVRYVVGAFAALRKQAAEPTPQAAQAAPTASLPAAPVQEVTA